MQSVPEWYYNEFSHAGVDYSEPEIVGNYDNKHVKFRNYKNEASQIIETLALSREASLLDMGCGTGGLSVEFAKYYKKVYAVDVSQGMIDLCNRKADENRLDNVITECAGFLTYNHEGEKLDGVVSTAVLHHLPDFWKQIALKRINSMLKPGGKFLLMDVVFSFPAENHIEFIEGWLANMENTAGAGMKEESVVHVRDEYSTLDWIMTGMLESAGFKIEREKSSMPNIQVYICSRKA